MRVNFQRIIILLLVSILSWGCKKSNNCKGDDTIKGDIIRAIDIDCPIWNVPNTLIIKDDSSYQNLRDGIPPKLTCILPEIDFENETLIGFYTSANCEGYFQGNIIKDENDKKYIYTVKVNECGNCEMLKFSYNWVTISKLPSDWTVEYRVRL